MEELIDNFIKKCKIRVAIFILCRKYKYEEIYLSPPLLSFNLSSGTPYTEKFYFAAPARRNFTWYEIRFNNS